MRIASLVVRCLAVAALLAGACAGSAAPDPLEEGTGTDGLTAWNIQKNPPGSDQIDPYSVEWDRFTFRDDGGKFKGSFVYLLANPRNLGLASIDIEPRGASVAAAGLFATVPVIDFQAFGLTGTTASATDRTFSATGDGGTYARITPKPATAASAVPSLLIEGRTAEMQWSLTVTQDWPGLTGGPGTFATMTAASPAGTTTNGAWGRLPGENWNVDEVWPRIQVTGTVTHLGGTGTPTPIAVSGHGYRENAWGQWAFDQGGWQSTEVSDPSANVMFSWHAYQSTSQTASLALDYLDVAFEDGGRLVQRQFQTARQELGWTHADWTVDPVATQCLPQSILVRAADKDYRVEATVLIQSARVAIPDDANATIQAFVEFLIFPTVSGQVTRVSDKSVVASFQGSGGGTFAFPRIANAAPTADDCATWGTAIEQALPW